MIKARGRFLIALLLATLLPVGLAAPASAFEDQTSAGFETVLRGTNDHRELNGIDRLVHDPRLSAVAQAWAEQMSADYASSHNLATSFRHNPNMPTQVPSGWQGVGENIAMNAGFPLPYEKLLDQWKNSPGHNANMLNTAWTHIGIGTYKDDQGITWGVQIFGDYGSPASTPDPVDAVIDLDTVSYSGTVQCVVLVSQPSGSEFFRQCGARPGNVFTFSDVPPGSYTVNFLAPSGGLLLSGWLVGGTLTPFVIVTGVSPGFGPSSGGTSVTVTGNHFTGATSVKFDGVAGTGLAVLSDTSLTVTTPAGTKAQAPVVVTVPSGASPASSTAFFAYADTAVVAGVPSVIADVAHFRPGVVRCYQVTGMAGVPVGAVGVVLNVTTSLPTAPGHVRVYPDYMNNGASPAPAVSTVNFEVARDVANSTTIALPTDGKVCAYGVGGTLARLILDVDGYILPGSGITLVTPEKLVDTRPQVQYHAGTINGPVQPMTDYTVQVGGVGSVPAGAVAVIANITVVDTRSPGHLRMWASDTTMPATSVVNYAPETKANSQIVALSADGRLTFRSFSYAPTSVSPVQVLIDVTGYIAAGSDFVATAPTKLVETRAAYGIVGPISGSLNPNQVYPVSVDTSVVPAGATAVVLNVTAVQPTNFGHIRVYPDTNGLGTTPPPVMSNLNFIPGRDIPNMVIVQLPADRKIDIYTAYAGTGRTDLVVNIIGYIAGPTL